MSVRPKDPAQQPERGGDGRRRKWSESPIPKVAARRVRLVGTPPPVVLPTAGSGVFNNDSSAPTYSGWSGSPAAGSMIVAIGVAHWYITATVGTVTAPSGWRSLASGSYGPGTGSHTTVWEVACIDSFAGTEGKSWNISDSPDPPDRVQVASWRVAGASGMTWQTPVVSTQAFTPTLSGGNWTASGDGAWAAPDESWLLNCQMMAPCGELAFTGSPDYPGGLATNLYTAAPVSPYSDSWNLTGSAQTAAIAFAVNAPDWLHTPYTPPLATVLSFAMGAK